MRRRRSSLKKGTKARPWRPSKRNAVMRFALMRRPTVEDVRGMDKRGCPICGADSSHLQLGEEPAYKSQPTALEFLGISCKRWIRGMLSSYCGECGTNYRGSKVLDWSVAKYARKFTDFGNVKMPLPFGKRKKSLLSTLRDQLKPAKRHLVNLRKRTALVKKPKCMRRMQKWGMILHGIPYREED